jgi:hypothetical protein
MISDPCNSTLNQGLYGDSEGFLGRFRTNFSNVGAGGSTATCGFLLVVPNYFGKDPMIAFSNADPSYHPLNTTAEAYGTGNTGATPPFFQNTAYFTNDNASAFVQGTTASDARLISACIRMTYFGSIVNSQGEVSMIENLPLATLLQGGTGSQPMNVNELFQYSGNSMRLGTDTIEVIARPDDDAKHFTDHDTKWSRESGSTPNTLLSEAQKVKQATAFGFAWRNCIPTANQSFQVIRNIEWRPDANLGIAAPTVRQYTVDLQPSVIATLDRSNPSWTRRIVNGALSVAAQVATTAFTGALPVAGQAGRYVAGRLASAGAQRLLM